MKNAQKLLLSWKKMIESSLKKHLRLNLGTFAGGLEKAMSYSVFPGGKRIRPLLTLASAHACGLDARKALPAACAVEFIHSYSLVHDDLPAMDNDDCRRGKPTVHKRFGEGMAVLTGDALLTLAFEVLAENSAIEPVKSLKTIRILGSAAGAIGMIAGQAADTFYDGKKTASRGKLLGYIHAKKTGALISASVAVGAATAGAPAHKFLALKRFGDKIGMAFQIVDDILDMDTDRLTYPAVYGIEKSRQKADTLIREAHGLLDIFGKKSAPLKILAGFVVQRTVSPQKSLGEQSFAFHSHEFQPTADQPLAGKEGTVQQNWTKQRKN